MCYFSFALEYTCLHHKMYNYCSMEAYSCWDQWSTLKEWLSNELEEWLSNNFGLLTLFLFRQNRNKIVIHKITSLLESSNAYMKVRVIYLTQYHNIPPKKSETFEFFI